jgi:hypothetical protein
MNGSIRPFLDETSAEQDQPDSLFMEAMHPLTAALPPKRSEGKKRESLRVPALTTHLVSAPVARGLEELRVEPTRLVSASLLGQPPELCSVQGSKMVKSPIHSPENGCTFLLLEWSNLAYGILRQKWMHICTCEDEWSKTYLFARRVFLDVPHEFLEKLLGEG